MSRRRSPQNMRVLVTGAASGIGEAVARQLGQAGAKLYLTDVNAARLDEVVAQLRSTGADVVAAVPADVTDEAAVRQLADEVHATTDALDAVLNIAGIAVWGMVEYLRPQDWRDVIEVNLLGPINVIQAFVPRMIAAGRGGHLVNVSSAAGLIALPWHAPYSASKFGLRGVSEVLRFDLARHGIAVTLVCPGGVDTPITRSVRFPGVDKDSPAFQRLTARFRRHAISPDEAAMAIILGMLRRRYLVHTSTDIRLLFALQRYVPPVYAGLMLGANRLATRLIRPALTGAPVALDSARDLAPSETAS